MLSFQLYVSGDNRGSLNLYNSSPDAFSDESEHVGLLLASHTAIAMASAQQEENLLHAIAARDLISQAKGQGGAITDVKYPTGATSQSTSRTRFVVHSSSWSWAARWYESQPVWWAAAPRPGTRIRCRSS